MFDRNKFLTILILGFSLFTESLYSQDFSFEECLQLKPEDHTSVINYFENNISDIINSEAIQENERLIRYPSNASSLLNTIANLEFVDSKMKQKIELAALCLSQISEVKVPYAAQSTAIHLVSELNSVENIYEAINLLDQLAKNYPEDRDISEALNVSIEILKDGRETIYHENDKIFQSLAEASNIDSLDTKKSAKGHAIDLAKSDVSGAIGGAIGGCVVGSPAAGVGCAPGAASGAVVGAIGNSTQKLIEKAFKYFGI